MSQAASGYERQSLERYYTPSWVTKALLQTFPSRSKIWDPAAGSGNILDTAKELGMESYGSDISPERGDIETQDFMASGSAGGFDIVTNPPYGLRGNLAVMFIQHALSLTQAHNGRVAMLLRNDFDSASSRRFVFADHPAFAEKLILTKRVRWTNLPQSAAGPTENHAWFVWDWAKPDWEPSQSPTLGYLP